MNRNTLKSNSWATIEKEKNEKNISTTKKRKEKNCSKIENIVEKVLKRYEEEEKEDDDDVSGGSDDKKKEKDDDNSINNNSERKIEVGNYEKRKYLEELLDQLINGNKGKNVEIKHQKHEKNENSDTSESKNDSFSEDLQFDPSIEDKNVRRSRTSVDHKGIPLSHPLATTPFPGASTSAQREKARKLLKSLGMKEKCENSSSSSSSKKKKKKKSKMSKNQSKKSSKIASCSNCQVCKKCAKKCSKLHQISIGDDERKKFVKSIEKLRKQMLKPEKRRKCSSRSQFDLTQSASEISLGQTNSK